MVEDHHIVRAGVSSLLNQESDIEVIGTVGSGEDALNFLTTKSPDVIIMDIGLPGMSGIETTRKVKEIKPAIRILALTMYREEEYLLGMLDAGANGYLLKQSAVSDLVQAVKSVSNDRSFLDPSVTNTVIEALRKPIQRHPTSDELSEREKDILQLIGTGATSKEIARMLSLSAKTIENYRTKILRKLRARTSSEAVSNAIKHHLIDPIAS